MSLSPILSICTVLVLMISCKGVKQDFQNKAPGATCKTDSDCSSTEECKYISESCTANDLVCVCYPKNLDCDKDDPCIPTTGGNNVCVDNSIGVGYCIRCQDYEALPGAFTIIGENTCEEVISPSRSPSVTSSPTSAASSNSSDAPTPPPSGASEDSGVCFDANLLAHIPMSDLVFSSHRRASVLCDSSGSCATRGHMTTYNGNPMMMGSYCKVTDDCTQRVMMVNSPKIGSKVRIPTNTEGLHFTALSARYETKLEEKILSRIINIGF